MAWPFSEGPQPAGYELHPRHKSKKPIAGSNFGGKDGYAYTGTPDEGREMEPYEKNDTSPGVPGADQSPLTSNQEDTIRGNTKYSGSRDDNVVDIDMSSHARPISPMGDQEAQMYFRMAVADCVSFVDFELSPLRATMTNYYNGQPFGDEQEGRSKIILTTVRDEIQAAIRQVMPVFFGSERVVEFVPRPKDSQPQTIARSIAIAREATDYLNFIFTERLEGFKQTMSVLNDGMLKRIGIFKWGWDFKNRPRGYCEYNLTREQLQTLAEDPEVDLKLVKPSHEERVVGLIGNNGQSPLPPVQFYVEYTRGAEEIGQPWVQALPPEEFLFNREARGKEYFLLMAHRMLKTRSELRTLGIDDDAIDAANRAPTLTLQMQPEAITRRAQITNAFMQDPKAGEANDKIIYVEAYMHLDVDGDGIAELRRICGIGENYWMVSNEPWDEPPFAIYTYDPQPHTIQGGSLADRTADIQHIQSLLARAVHDSLSLSIYPRTVVTEGGVANPQDVYNTEIGAVIWETKPQAVRELTHTFQGKEAVPILQWWDSIREQRVGMNRGANAMDSDALQSMDSDTAQKVADASQSQVEQTCRIFAETMKQVFRGLYRMYCRYRPAAEVVRLRGQYTQVDPGAWDTDMDVMVNVGLGTGARKRKLDLLAGIIAKQEQYLQLLGPQNPLVSLPQLSNAIHNKLEMEGEPDTTQYFNRLPPNFQMPAQPPQQQADPAHTLAMAQVAVEKMRAEKELAIKQTELLLKAQDSDRKWALDQAQLASDNVNKRMQADAQFHADITEQQQDTAIRQADLVVSSLLQAEKQHHDIVNMHNETALAAQQAQQQAAEAAQPEPEGENGNEG